MVKNPTANAREAADEGLIPGSGRSSEEGHDNPLQYSCLENPMNRGAWRRLQSMGAQRVGRERAHKHPLMEIRMEEVLFRLQKQESRPLILLLTCMDTARILCLPTSTTSQVAF